MGAAECLPASGSSCFLLAAAAVSADAAADAAMDADVEMTVVCGSSFFSSSAADAATDAETASADADANVQIDACDLHQGVPGRKKVRALTALTFFPV